MQSVDKVRKWEKRWLTIGETTMKVYKWVPVKSETVKPKKNGQDLPESKESASNNNSNSHSSSNNNKDGKDNNTGKATSATTAPTSATATPPTPPSSAVDDKENGNRAKNQTNPASSSLKTNNGIVEESLTGFSELSQDSADLATANGCSGGSSTTNGRRQQIAEDNSTDAQFPGGDSNNNNSTDNMDL